MAWNNTNNIRISDIWVLISYARLAFTTVFQCSLSWMSSRLENLNKSRKKQYHRPRPKKPIPTTTTRWIYMNYVWNPCKDCFGRVVDSSAATTISMSPKDGEKGKLHVNVGSYNYLDFGGSSPDGFLEDWSRPVDGNSSLRVSECTNRFNASAKNAEELRCAESEFASFIGTEDCVFFPMGWGTNVSVIPLLARSDPSKPGRVLIMSDELNHASIRMGFKLSNYDQYSHVHCLAPKIVCFKNNSPQDLRRKLERELSRGGSSKYQKILIVVEGIYSMEGNILKLPQFVEIKEEYSAFLYVDEAHSIGALGDHGKGICDYCGIDTSRVDILMGTFTKSFASVGGYCAATRETIDWIRKNSFVSLYETCMPTACVQQIRYVLRILSGAEGQKRFKTLTENSLLLRELLLNKGIEYLGDPESPIIPIITPKITSMAGISRGCSEKGLAIVVAGYPATDFRKSRVRLCLSSGHTKEQIQFIADTLHTELLREGLAGRYYIVRCT